MIPRGGRQGQFELRQREQVGRHSLTDDDVDAGVVAVFYRSGVALLLRPGAERRGRASVTEDVGKLDDARLRQVVPALGHSGEHRGVIVEHIVRHVASIVTDGARQPMPEGSRGAHSRLQQALAFDPPITPLEMIQPWKYSSWNRVGEHPKPEIIPERMRMVWGYDNPRLQQALAELDASFFRVRFDRLTPTEKRYMRAMAELGPGPHRSGDIADVLGRKVTTVAPVRNALIAKGMLYSPAHGDTAFTVPLFDGFMKRNMPAL